MSRYVKKLYSPTSENKLNFRLKTNWTSKILIFNFGIRV